MAQAKYAFNAVRALITVASAKPSTHPVRATDLDWASDLITENTTGRIA
jgi:hypothetical protein